MEAAPALAQGGAEVFLKNLRNLWAREHRHMWLLFAEYCLSTLWAFTYGQRADFPVGLAVPLPEGIRIHSLLTPAFTGPVLGVVCLLQFTVSLLLEKRYEKGFGRSLFWIIWYPLVYWLLSLLTTLVAFSKVMLKARRGRARWISPDRGIGRIKE